MVTSSSSSSSSSKRKGGLRRLPGAQKETEEIFERRWEHIEAFGDIYSPRTGHCCVEKDGVFYLFAGTDKRRRQQDMYKFYSHSLEWEKVHARGDIPTRRSGALGVEHGGSMYVFGGYDGRDGNYFNSIHRFEFRINEWTLVRPRVETRILQPQEGTRVDNDQVVPVSTIRTSNKPNARTDHCLVCYKDTLIVFGGYDGHHRYNDTHAFDLKTNRWRELNTQQPAEERPSKRFGHSGVVHEDKLWIFGGWDGKETLDCIWALDLKTEVWTCVDKLRQSVPRTLKSSSSGSSISLSTRDINSPSISHGTNGSSCLTPTKRKRYVFEQNDNSENFQNASNSSSSSSEMKNMNTCTNINQTKKVEEQEVKEDGNERKEMGSSPQHRYRHSACLHGNSMVIFGGVNKDHRRFNDLHKFDFKTLTWQPIEVNGQYPSARTFHRALCVHGKMYILGGYDGVDRLNDMHIMDLGGLSPPPLAELAASFIRKNLAQVAKFGDIDLIPPFVVDNLIWTRDHNGLLRGGRFGEDGRQFCNRLQIDLNDIEAQRQQYEASLVEFEESKDTDSSDDDYESIRSHNGSDDETASSAAERPSFDPCCLRCGGKVSEHELVSDENLLDTEWQPDVELASSVGAHYVK